MKQEQIKLLENIIDKEIDGYKDIAKLYADKKEILIHAKATELFNVDEEIKNVYKRINNLSNERKKITVAMQMPTFSLTDIINRIKEEDKETAQKFEQKREQVQTLAKNIFELEKVNLELIKHGMHVTNKTLEIIIKGLKPITNEYNQNGKNITKEKLEMSSIIEEA